MNTTFILTLDGEPVWTFDIEHDSRPHAIALTDKETIRIAVAAEREACAKVADEEAIAGSFVAEKLAAAIRARK